MVTYNTSYWYLCSRNILDALVILFASFNVPLFLMYHGIRHDCIKNTVDLGYKLSYFLILKEKIFCEIFFQCGIKE